MEISKPDVIVANAFMSRKWDEVTDGRTFAASDVPVLTLLCQWYAIAQRCLDDLAAGGGAVVFTNKMGDVKALPQIATLKQASTEIRQLNKQLGIKDEAEVDEEEASNAGDSNNVLTLLVSKHDAERRAGSEG